MASAESLPDELTACADEVRIQFPWGSLLEAVLKGDPAVLAGIARLLRPNGRLRVILSVVERDRIQGTAALDGQGAADVVARIAETNVGLVAEPAQEATQADIAASHSTWAKRLGAGRSRPAWLMQFRRLGRPEEQVKERAGPAISPNGGVVIPRTVAGQPPSG